MHSFESIASIFSRSFCSSIHSIPLSSMLDFFFCNKGHVASVLRYSLKSCAEVDGTQFSARAFTMLFSGVGTGCVCRTVLVEVVGVVTAYCDALRLCIKLFTAL